MLSLVDKPYCTLQTTLQYKNKEQYEEHSNGGDSNEVTVPVANETLCSLCKPFSSDKELNYLDLHGVHSASHARAVFLYFMKRVLKSTVTVVTVITGRGKHAEPGKPAGVLARSLPKWINSDKVLHRHVRHCNMSHLGGCYVLKLQNRDLRERDDVLWLSTAEHYKVCEMVRSKRQLYRRYCYDNPARMVTERLDNTMSYSFGWEIINHDGKKWLRDEGKVALARTLDLRVVERERKMEECQKRRGRRKATQNFPSVIKQEIIKEAPKSLTASKKDSAEERERRAKEAQMPNEREKAAQIVPGKLKREACQPEPKKSSSAQGREKLKKEHQEPKVAVRI
jgi:hypothetical protein